MTEEAPETPFSAVAGSTEPAFGFWSSRPFRSSKTPEVIQAETRLHEDWLCIASLDEGVAEIRVPPPGLLGEGAEAPDFVVAEVGGGERLVFLLPTDADPGRREAVQAIAAASDRRGAPAQVVEEAEVLREPRLRNVRMVYACRRTKVSPTDRVQVLHHLTEVGRSNLLDASRCVRSPDAAESVLALVTEGTVMVDVERTLGPEMPVWRVRTQADEASGYD